MTLEGSTALRFSGVSANSATAEAVASRSSVMAMTQQAEEAVLRPLDCGRWSHSLRAALASRMAQQHRMPALARHYSELIDDSSLSPIADPDKSGDAQGLAVVVRFMDRVAVQPRDVVAQDISELQAAGIEDADIVRLTELNAFMAYQLRLMAGLALMSGAES